MNQINLETKSEMEYQDSTHWRTEAYMLREILARKLVEIAHLEEELRRLSEVINAMPVTEESMGQWVIK